MDKNKKIRVSYDTRKLTIEQKRLIVEKIRELEASNVGNRKLSNQKLANIIGQRFLKRVISKKVIQKYRKESVASSIIAQPQSDSKLCQLRSDNIIDWQASFDQFLSNAFSYANLSLRMVLSLAMHFGKTKIAHPKKTVFNKTWGRSYLKRMDYTYRIKKKNRVVAAGTLEKANKEMTEICKDNFIMKPLRVGIKTMRINMRLFRFFNNLKMTLY